MSSSLLGFGAALFLFALVGGRISLWDQWGPGLWSAPVYGMAAGLVIAAAGALLARGRREPLRLGLNGLTAGLLLLILTDWICRPYSLYPGPSFRGELLLLSAGIFILLRERARFPAPIAAICSALLLLGWFFSVAGGRMIFSDDHPSFIYRLKLLAENFPLVPIYTPLWNAGMEWRDFFGVGALNLFFISLPLRAFGSIEQVYTASVALIVFVALPGGVYLGARVLRLDRQAAAVGALLALAPALFWYRWAFKYGAMGFVTAASLIPLNLALMTKWFDRSEQLGRGFTAAAIVCITLSIIWPLSPLMLAVPPLLAVPWLPVLVRKPRFLLIGVCIVALNLPWMILFANVSKVTQFLHVDAALEQNLESAGGAGDGVDDESTHWSATSVKRPKREISLAALDEVLSDTAATFNPLLIVFGLPGVLLLERRWHRAVFGVTAAWLTSIATFGALLKPQFELDRFLVVAALVFCIPAGAAIAALLEPPRGRLRRAAGAFVAACLVGGIFSAGYAVHNRSAERYSFATARVSRMADFVRGNAGSGRVAFTGFILHELSGGHFAPLPHFSGVPALGIYPTHSRWRYEDLVPLEIKKQGAAGIERFFDIHHVTLIAAHEPWWKRFLQSHPELYRTVGTIGRFDFYVRPGYNGSYFLSGGGTVEEQPSGAVRLRLSTPDAVIKFNYLPIITAGADCSLEPYAVDGLQLISLQGCPTDRIITIEALPPWQRLW